MKGVAILSVVIGHYVGIAPLKYIIWSFHLPLFVFISGYFIKPETSNLVSKAAKAYLKPYCIVWLALIVFEVFKAFYGGDSIIESVQTRFLSGIFGIGSNNTLHRPDFVIKIGAIWFLYALFMSFVYVRLFSKISQFGIRALSYVALMILLFCLSQYVMIPFNIAAGASFVLWLLAGHYYHKGIDDKLPVRGAILVIASLLWSITLILQMYTKSSFDICRLYYPLYGFEIIGALSGIAVIYNFSKYIQSSRLGDVLTYIGNRSLWILCVHAFSIEHSLWPFPEYDVYGIIHCVVDVILALFLCHVYKTYISSDKKSYLQV